MRNEQKFSGKIFHDAHHVFQHFSLHLFMCARKIFSSFNINLDFFSFSYAESCGCKQVHDKDKFNRLKKKIYAIKNVLYSEYSIIE